MTTEELKAAQAYMAQKRKTTKPKNTLSEAAIEKRMGEYIKKQGGLFYKFVSPGTVGVPDRIVVTPAGKVYFVELKAEQGTVAPLQRWHVDELRKRGADARIIRGWAEAEKFLKEVMPNGV
ncbi:VRR-NUC domain-containing protein [Eubacteriales bacterium OttesenSCG-928-G02]|nr:VRR-NUC domain-containing protein [Eubacteriales bacterium OttesenSCG-928-G02]